jgi:MOSC domain-containing protein YiiM
MQTMHDLLTHVPQIGRVDWIGVAAARKADIESVAEVVVQAGTGIDGEHHAKSGKSERQVTLIQHEHLPAVAALLHRAEVSPALLRRNIVVSGINLLALKTRQFTIGEALLEGTGPCEPCSRMEENLGPGGYNAMRGHGGITARVLRGGRIRTGDAVAVAGDPGA